MMCLAAVRSFVSGNCYCFGLHEYFRITDPWANGFELNANEFTKDGYVFDVWNTKADGSGTAYEDRQWNTNCFITADSQTCNDPTNFAHIGETVTLYAQWTEAYTIHFNGNESNGAYNSTNNTMTDQSAKSGRDTMLIGNLFYRDNYSFKSWNTKADGSGDSYSNYAVVRDLAPANGEITLYAQWKVSRFTVLFDPNGGTGTMGAQNFTTGNYGWLNANKFTRKNYVFASWNTKADGTGESYGNNVSMADFTPDQLTITLYAQWNPLYTCTKQYRLQNADGSYPDEYTSDGSAEIEIGKECTYTKNIYSYNTISDSVTITGPTTISLDLPRNTYTLTINKNDAAIDSVNGAGVYRWGEIVPISASPKEGNVFMSWNTTTNIGDANSATTTYTMPRYDSSIYADGKERLTYTMFDTGPNVNKKFMILDDIINPIENSENTTTKAFVRTLSLPNDFEPSDANIISAKDSAMPIYTWIDADGTMYYYSDDATLFLNPNSSRMFANMWLLEKTDISTNTDASKVETMNSMFYFAGRNVRTFHIDLSGWNTSSLTDVGGMFSYAAYYKANQFHVNLTGWDTSKVANMSSMFMYAGYCHEQSCKENESYWLVEGISDWDTSNVTKMGQMFQKSGYYSRGNFSVDISDWNMSKVTSVWNMFFDTGGYASVWSVIIPKTNSNGLLNTSTTIYGSTQSYYYSLNGKTFTLAE